MTQINSFITKCFNNNKIMMNDESFYGVESEVKVLLSMKLSQLQHTLQEIGIFTQLLLFVSCINLKKILENLP